MTNYCEPEDIQVLVRRLDLDNANTDISTADITKIIERKSAYIDSALTKRYVVPFQEDDIPPVIADLCIQFVLRQIEPNIGATITGEEGEQIAAAYDPEETLFDYVNGIKVLEARYSRPRTGVNVNRISYSFPEKEFTDSKEQW